MILRVDERRLILLASAVEASIARFVTDVELRLEAGGIFIGSHRGQHVEIATCTTPLPGDVRRPTSFDRKDPGHHAAASAAWHASGGLDSYVGEWHTHPVDDPKPSHRDLQTWRRITRRTREPVIVLIAGRRSLWCARAYGDEFHEATVFVAP